MTGVVNVTVTVCFLIRRTILKNSFYCLFVSVCLLAV